MKKNKPLIWIATIFIILIIAASLLLSSLGTPSATQATPTYAIPTKTTRPSPTAPPTLTPDPCSPNNLPAGIEPLHKLIRKFDDAYLLAQNTPIQSLTPLISEMQELRREAEDYLVPACATDLKADMLAYMNTVLETLMEFTSGGDYDTINQGIDRARSLHDTYIIELSRLMGWTLVPTPSPAQPDETPTVSE